VVEGYEVRSIPDAIAAHYRSAGIRQLFGVVGSTNFEVTHRLVERGAGFVAARHETNAVVMAESWALATGEVGLVTVHTGPGLTNAATGIAEATKSDTPMVVLAGDIANGAVHSNFAMDQAGFCRAMGAATERLYSARTALVDAARALERAERERTVVVLHMPLDIQAAPVATASEATPRLGGPVRAAHPDPADVEQLADLLEAARRPLILAGIGAVHAGAGDALRAVGARAGALLATTARAHGLFSGDPWSLGISGGFGSPAVVDLMPEADLLVSFGARLTTWTTRFGRLLAGVERIVQVDTDPTRLGAGHPADLGIAADARLVASQVRDELARRGVEATGWRTTETAERMRRGANNEWEYEDVSTETAVDPRTFTKALDAILPRDRTVVTDGGHFSGWPTRHLRVPDASGWIFKQSFQSIGLGLATAIGAATARPDRVTVAALGDGGAMMSIADLETAIRLRLSMLIVVYNDSAYGAEVHHFAPMGFDPAIVTFPTVDFARIARGHGADGVVVSRLTDMDPIRKWVDAGCRGVFVVDVRVNPDLVADWLTEALQIEHG
jgi:thiamine pyrophosphate-dependent acetolactate synthase large subunit-like protein